MGDKTDSKNESPHPMTDNEDDPSHMGDDNHQHDEHDDNDDNTQAIATCTQAQLASLVEHAASNAISQERTNFHSQITKLEMFHKEEVDNTRNDFTRLLQEATTNVPTETPPKTRFFTPHTKRRQDVDYARLTAGANKERTDEISGEFCADSTSGPAPAEGTSAGNFGGMESSHHGNSSSHPSHPSQHGSSAAPAPTPIALSANPALPNTSDPQMVAFTGVMIAQQQALTKVVGDMSKGKSNKDISEPTKFNGNDDKWEEWQKLLRSYFKLKGWLPTSDHPIIRSRNPRPPHPPQPI
jgi:hypothetical protein